MPQFRTRCARVVAGILLLSLLSPTAFGQGQPSVNPAPEWTARLDGIAQQLGDDQLTDPSLLPLRDEVEAIRREARAWLAAQVPRIEAARLDLEALGPPPAAGEEPEGAERAALRAELSARLNGLKGPVLEAELVAARIAKVSAQIGEIRRKRFTDRLLARGPSPLSRALLARAVPGLGEIAGTVSSSIRVFVGSAALREATRGSVVSLLAAATFALILAWPLNTFLRHRYGRAESGAPASYMLAIRAAIVVGATGALLPAIGAVLLYSVLRAAGLLEGAGAGIALAVLVGFVLFTSTVALLRAFLSPLRPEWRVVPISTNLAVGLRRTVSALAVVIAVDIIIEKIIVTFDARLAVTQLVDYAVSVVLTLLIVLLLLSRKVWMPEAETEKPRWRSLRLIAALGFFAAPVLGAAGYVALARLIVTQAILTGGLVFVFLTARRLGREMVAWTIASETVAGEWLRTFLPKDEEGTSRLAFWFGVVFDLALIFLGVIAALFVWGADGRDVGDWAYRAVFGFNIGPITLSMVDLAVAIALFVGLFLTSRFVQRMLTEKVLPQTQLDPGIRQSIGTATGYVGIVIAVAVGVSALGLDLSNLALVAGALSVGIGFGLQNVVNNFVSGLILLVERPVKVGDWVIVGGLEGHVRRINVRATEIQTFDRASVFVPNSQLISETVTNWTHGDKFGRVRIPVGVAYGSDTRLVEETLASVARAHPEVIPFPKPAAVFMGFGDNALNFELRCFLRDINAIVGATSSLCFAVDDEFRKAGIKIPFPQRDVHMYPAPPQTNDAP